MLVAALRAAAEACAGVRFAGVWLPGINRVDYAGLHPQARASARPSSPATWRHRSPPAASTSGRCRTSRRSAACATGFADRSRDPAHGASGCGGEFVAGVANDFTPSILANARRKVALVNPADAM
ncbi:MAG: hypothetical protein IPK78_19715 [Rhodospirillales bacterium]|nr:hypothetical protein [Rhodospirillales bacterium]